MATASFNGTVIAESDDIVIVEGNAYFPIASLDWQFVEESAHSTRCPWKGVAAYWDVVVDGERAVNAAWYYQAPLEGAEAVAHRVAFYSVITVEQ